MPEPAGYDPATGQPLYTHPPGNSAQVSPTVPPAGHPQVVYMARPLEPVQPHISEDVQRRHDESKSKYQRLNLSDGEFVISAIRRHPIGLFSIWVVVALIIIGIFTLIPIVMANQIASSFINAENSIWLAMLLLGLSVFIFLGGVIATIVYNANRFYLTNESVIQHIQTSLFSKKEQTISLANIEDASYRQHGIIQQLFGYGSLRLSTEGDETTYRFNYVANPHKQLNILNNSVEAFKNGRPVDLDEDS